MKSEDKRAGVLAAIVGVAGFMLGNATAPKPKPNVCPAPLISPDVMPFPIHPMNPDDEDRPRPQPKP